MSEMVERVAKAICESSGQSWESAGDGYREICDGFARAAIEAMREPTEDMQEAADMDRTYYGHIATNNWRAMISAALT